jgi:hypothetical protein
MPNEKATVSSSLRTDAQEVIHSASQECYALFYKNLHGAQAGDLFRSLIHTCKLCAVPVGYWTELQRHSVELASKRATEVAECRPRGRMTYSSENSETLRCQSKNTATHCTALAVWCASAERVIVRGGLNQSVLIVQRVGCLFAETTHLLLKNNHHGASRVLRHLRD